MRKKKGKGFTLRALKTGLSKLNKLAIDDYTKIEIVDKSTESCWNSFFPINENKTLKKEKDFIDLALEYEREVL